MEKLGRIGPPLRVWQRKITDNRQNLLVKYVGAQYFVPEISHKDVGKNSLNIITMLNWMNLLLCRTIFTALWQ